jgi:hypothetical protein
VFDLLMSEYGGSPREIAENWMPGQAVVMAQRIRRRRAMRDAQAVELGYVMTAAAQGGREGYRAMRRLVDELRREGGAKQGAGRGHIRDLAKALGLKQR